MASIPMTMSMEIMAEASSLLVPEKLLVGMKEVRARHWITVEEGPASIEIRVRKLDSQALIQVHVAIWDLKNNPPLESGTNAPTVEGVVLFDDSYPTAPLAQPLVLENERTPKYTAQEMYEQRIMFHGPRFQGMTRLDRIGENGVEGELIVLPNDNLFSSNKDPEIMIDPFLLDAAGQFVGYWPFECLERDFVLFPIHLDELKMFGPRPK